NQMEQVRDELFSLLSQGEIIEDRLKVATDQIMRSHAEELETNAENELVEFADEELNEFDVHEFRQIQDNLEELTEIIPNLKAAELLEKQQKDFKIGFFNSKKKTEEVREQKLQQFLEPLLKTIDSTILWKLREKFVEILQENDIQDETLLNKAQQFSFDFGEAELKAHVKQGAKVNGNYI